MRFIEKGLVNFLAFLCEAFNVTPENLHEAPRGNLPPEPTGTQTIYRFR